MQHEQWKQIKGFSGFYWISSFGKVKKILPNGNTYFLKCTPNKNRHNYFYVNLETTKERKNCLLHRLVATYFIPNLQNKSCVNHIDCEVGNNNVENLEWVTPQENSNHAKKLNRMWHPIGELAGNSKLKEKTVKNILKDISNGKKTYLKIAEKYKTNYSNIAHIARGSRWGYLKNRP